jgi:hypothetical protein
MKNNEVTLKIADQQSHLPIQFEVKWTVRDISTTPTSPSASKTLGGHLDLWRAGAKWRRRGWSAYLIHHSLSRTTHLLSLFLVVIQFHSGSIHLQQLINSKAKEQNKLSYVYPRARYTATHSRTKHLSKAHRTAKRVYIYIRDCLYEQWLRRYSPAVSLRSRTKIVLRTISLLILSRARAPIVFAPFEKDQKKVYDCKLFLP